MRTIINPFETFSVLSLMNIVNEDHLLWLCVKKKSVDHD